MTGESETEISTGEPIIWLRFLIYGIIFKLFFSRSLTDSPDLTLEIPWRCKVLESDNVALKTSDWGYSMEFLRNRELRFWKFLIKQNLVNIGDNLLNYVDRVLPTWQWINELLVGKHFGTKTKIILLARPETIAFYKTPNPFHHRRPGLGWNQVRGRNFRFWKLVVKNR